MKVTKHFEDNLFSKRNIYNLTINRVFTDIKLYFNNIKLCTYYNGKTPKEKSYVVNGKFYKYIIRDNSLITFLIKKKDLTIQQKKYFSRKKMDLKQIELFKKDINILRKTFDLK